jgi:hypothetical protein
MPNIAGVRDSTRQSQNHLLAMFEIDCFTAPKWLTEFPHARRITQWSFASVPSCRTSTLRARGCSEGRSAKEAIKIRSRELDQWAVRTFWVKRCYFSSVCDSCCVAFDARYIFHGYHKTALVVQNDEQCIRTKQDAY